MDKQFAAAVMLIIFGFALTQMGQDDDGEGGVFLVGLGVGTVAVASFWIVLRIIADIKKNRGGGRERTRG